MNELTISQVSAMYDVTPRMLRHYEKLGLITTIHRDDYAYRLYDENAVRRLQQIIILRKLRISLKEIAEIMKDEFQNEALRILQENLDSLNDELNSMHKIRLILQTFIGRINKSIRQNIKVNMLEDSVLVELIGTLALSKERFKEKISMSELDKAEKVLNKNTSIRLVMLPPCTVAANHVIGKEPEETVGDEMDKFIRESRLYEIKPDSRYFGFNHPNPGILPNGEHGYEVWVTIPDDMDVPEPLIKKHFEGGLYAALTISFPDFYRWGELENWVKESDTYEERCHPLGYEVMGGCLEEHLNWVYSSHMGWPENGIDGQLDLLMPIRKKSEK